MSSVLVPEVQLAQKLACNEKPVRTRALKRLRKYVGVRSQTKGGFSAEELLRLWKGLFYCLWMQDKPLLQEELSNQISTLIHSFHRIDQQFLYLETFLQTISREWTGIDRLRLDKFYQLVRFMFRQTFEALKRRNWDTRAVSQFLDLLTREVLQNSSDASSELQLHILDLYLNELAAVSSAELTADQNLVFIDPFCKTAAKTKNRTLFSAVCTSVFSAIIDHAPFAIEDLMKEVKAAEEEEVDSGQESQEEDLRGTEKMRSTGVGCSPSGSKSNGAEEEDHDDLHQSEGSDAELHDMGPVLQFDYGAVADRLFELASRTSTPTQNRKRLYRIIRALRNLSKGIFPKNEYPEDVSTDEDDDMFGSRKRMKRSRADMEGGGAEEKKEKKKKKRKEASTGSAEVLDTTGHNVDPADGLDQKQSQSKTGLNKQPSSDSKPEEQQMSCGGEVPVPARKKRKRKKSLAQAGEKVSPAAAENTHLAGESSGAAGSPAEVQTEEECPNSTKNGSTPSTQDSPAASAKTKTKTKRKRTRKRRALQADEEQNDATDSAPQTSTQVPVRKMTKKNQAPEQATAAAEDSEVQNQEEPGATTGNSEVGKKTATQKRKRKKVTGGQMNEVLVQQMEVSGGSQQMEVSGGSQQVEVSGGSQQVEVSGGSQQVEVSGGSQEMEARLGSSEAQSVKKKRRKIPVEFEFEADELKAMSSANVPEDTRAGKKKNKKKTPFQDVSQLSMPSGLKNPATGSGCDFIRFQNKVLVPSPLFCRTKGRLGPSQSTRKKNQSLSESKKVTFGLRNNKTAEFRKTDRSLLLSPEGSSRVPFDPQQKPKCGVLKSPPLTTPTSRKKTPRSPASKLKRRPMAADFF